MALWGIHGLVNEDFTESCQIVLQRPMIGDLVVSATTASGSSAGSRTAYP